MAKKTTTKELGEMMTHVVKNMATKDDIKNMVTKDDVKNMATKDDLKNLATKADIAGINRRLDTIIQIQLDQHASRIKKLETTVFK